MTIRPKYGIGKLRFGFKPKQVKAILGEPDEIRTDEDEPNKYYIVYNDERLRLTFYKTKRID